MGFIKDKYGQYKHPGKNTLIPNANGRITMKGINYPVLGVDDLGNKEIMMPGGEYQFPGNSVYEMPLMGFGGRITPTGGSQVIEGQLCDAYGRPIDPARAKAADVNNNYRGPGMKHGGSLPKAQNGQQFSVGDFGGTEYIEGEGTLNYTPVNSINEKAQWYIDNKPDSLIAKIIQANQAENLYDQGIQFNIDWLNSPMAIEMMKKEDPENWKELQRKRIANLKNIDIDGRTYQEKEGLFASSNSGDGDITIHPEGWNSWTTAVHEASHSSDRDLPYNYAFGPNFNNSLSRYKFFDKYKGQRLIPKSSLEMMSDHVSNAEKTKRQKQNESITDIIAFLTDSKSTYKTNDLLEVYNTNDEFKRDYDALNIPKKLLSTRYIKNVDKSISHLMEKQDNRQEWFNYYSKHTEQRARLMAIRGLAATEGIYNPFTEKVTPEIIKKLKNYEQDEVNPVSQLLQIMTEEELMEELNKISREVDDPFNVQDDFDSSLQMAQDGLELNNQFVIPADNTRVVLPIQPFETNIIEEDDIEDDVSIDDIQDNNELYKGLETVDINGATYYVYTIEPNDNKSSVSDKFGLWNEQGILNSVNTKYGKSKDHDNYKLNNTRFWPGGKILVGGPEFNSHVQYNTDRDNYINSFQDIPEDQLWSAISAIGHLETGSKVKYARPEGREYVEGVDIKDGKPVAGGLYEYDNNPWTGTVESGMDNAYKFVSSANALGRFGIKEVHLDEYAKNVLGYTEDQNWKQTYLKSKTDQQKLMKYLITDVYPKELSQLRHSYPDATSQYSDFQLLSALHRAGYGNVEEQLGEGQFSYASVPGDISIGGYVDKAGGLLNPDLDVSDQPFFIRDAELHKPYLDIPSYSLGGSVGKLDPLMRDKVIGDMLENGAFLPKFKLGSEKTIKGALGKYKIKKSFDNKANLPYVQFTNSDNNISNNRVYYDKDDVDASDDFNIIDVYQQREDKDREHARLLTLIHKYEQGEKMSPTELNYLKDLDLVDDEKVKTPKVVATPPMPSKNKFLLDIDISKDIVNKNKSRDGVPLDAQIAMYQAYTNSLFEEKVDMRDYTSKLKKIYDKLNRVYYWESKTSKMTVLDYMKSLNN